MKKQYWIILICGALLAGGSFYWYEIRPTSIRKNCFNMAESERQTTLTADNNAIINGIEVTKRADYDKIFNDEYKNCILKSGIKE